MVCCYLLTMQFSQINLDKPRDAVAGNLITPWDEYEILFMESFLRDDQLANFDPANGLSDGFWIGVKYWEWRKGQGKRWGSVDNWPLTYTRWNEQAPMDNGDCAFMAPAGGWMNEDCNLAKPFVCKVIFQI